MDQKLKKRIHDRKLDADSVLDISLRGACERMVVCDAFLLATKSFGDVRHFMVRAEHLIPAMQRACSEAFAGMLFRDIPSEHLTYEPKDWRIRETRESVLHKIDEAGVTYYRYQLGKVDIRLGVGHVPGMQVLVEYFKREFAMNLECVYIEGVEQEDRRRYSNK